MVVMTIPVDLRNVRLGLRAESPEAKGLLSRTALFSTYVPCEIDRRSRRKPRDYSCWIIHGCYSFNCLKQDDVSH